MGKGGETAQLPPVSHKKLEDISQKKENECVSTESNLVSSGISTAIRHFNAGNFNWPMIVYLTLSHIAAIVGLFKSPYCNKYTLIFAFVLWPITIGTGITAGVHRLWAHRSYKASFILRVFLMLTNSMANQGSIWHWARDHRVHHKHSEVFINFVINYCALFK